MNNLQFFWLLEGILAGSSKPQFSYDMKYLRQEGIKSIITLTISSLDTELLKIAGIENYLHIPLYYSGFPEKKQIIETIEFIKKEGVKDNPVLVHCDEGYNRTGIILALYLIEVKFYTIEKALEFVRKQRTGAISEKQEIFLKNYADNNGISKK